VEATPPGPSYLLAPSVAPPLSEISLSSFYFEGPCSARSAAAQATHSRHGFAFSRARRRTGRRPRSIGITVSRNEP